VNTNLTAVIVAAVTITQSAVRLTGPRSPARLHLPNPAAPSRCCRAAAVTAVEFAVTAAVTIRCRRTAVTIVKIILRRRRSAAAEAAVAAVFR
jgi:hypothetical protein